MIPCVVFCASHIKNQQQLELLKCTIESILNQSTKVSMWISISTRMSSLDIPYIDEPFVHIFPHYQKRLSQFEHFMFLVNQLEQNGFELNKTFCIFCDDDDYSHPYRVEFYSNSKDKGQHSLLAKDAILLLENSQYENTQICKLIDNLEEKEGINGHEYFMFCVRASILKRFCEILIQYKCIRSPICDILLSSVLINSNTLSRSCRPLSWLYVYNTHPEKNRNYEIELYQTLIKIPGLLPTLEKEFNIKWYNNLPGYVSIYGNDYFINHIALNQEIQNQDNIKTNKNNLDESNNTKLIILFEKNKNMIYLGLIFLVIFSLFLVPWWDLDRFFVTLFENGRDLFRKKLDVDL